MADMLTNAASVSAVSKSSNDLNASVDNDSSDGPLRQGKWTREEEEYVNCLIDEFKTGMMPLAEGTSLRTFLSKMLNCHPMRISKKFVGSNYNGKQIYVRRTGANRLSNEEVRSRRAKLCELERKFLNKVSPGGPDPTITPGASAALPTPHASQAVSMNNLSSAAPLQANPSLHNIQNHGVSISASGVELRALSNAGQSPSVPRNSNRDFPRNITLLEVPQSTGTGGVNSSSSGNHDSNNDGNLQNVIRELMANGGGNSMEVLQMMQQQQQNQHPSQGQQQSQQHRMNINSRAAAAGRALLQSGGGLGLGLDTKRAASRPSDSNNMPNKPLESFTSAELAAELRKRSSLKDLMNGFGNQSNRQSSITNFQAPLQPPASGDNNSAFASLMRNASMDMSNLIERQGSIDSLSNLAVRSRLQSLQSLSSLLDPVDTSTFSGGVNKNWAPNTHSHSSNNRRGSLLAKVSTDSIGAYRKTANDLIQSLGVRQGSMGNFGASTSQNNGIRGSGLDLASLLNNEDALRRLQESAPSSLDANSNWTFLSSSQDNSSSQQQQDNKTALAQFLLKKKLVDAHQQQQQQQSGGGSAARAKAAASLPSSSSQNHNHGTMDSSMSSMLSSLKSSGEDNDDAMETLKRKFLSQDGLMAAAAQAREEQRRKKPFR